MYVEIPEHLLCAAMKPAEHCDFLVVGSGLVGTVAAILFSNLGYSVAVVEKNAPPCIFDVQGTLLVCCRVRVYLQTSFLRNEMIRRV